MSKWILLIPTLAAAVAVACAQSDPQQAAPPATTAAAPAPAPPAATPAVASPESAAPAAVPAPAPPAGAAAPLAGAAAATASPAPAPAAAKISPAPATSPAATPVAAAPAATPVATPVASAPPPVAPAPEKPPAPPKPVYREVIVPAGTELSVKLLNTVASTSSKVEDTVKGALAQAVVISGTTALKPGTQITGSVISVKESGRVKGKASVQVRFDRMVIDNETRRIDTADVSFEADDKKSDDVKKGGLGAGLGAAIGGIAGGGKGAAIGAIAGGTGAVLATKGREIEIAPGTVVTVLLQEPLTVRQLIK